MDRTQAPRRSGRRRYALATAALFGLGLPALAPGQAVTRQTIALTGRPAPGTPAGVNYGASLGGVAVNGNGRVAYSSSCPAPA